MIYPSELAATFGSVTLLAASFVVALPCTSRAHDASATIGHITISNIAVTAVRAGEKAKITFSVENSGSERVTISGLRLQHGEPSRVMGSFGTSYSGDIGNLVVAPGESARLDGHKAWIEVGPLVSDLPTDSIVSGRLVLGAFEAPLSIHVVPPQKEPSREFRQSVVRNASLIVEG